MAHMLAVGDVLIHNCQSLEHVDVSFNDAVGEEGLRRVARGLQRLQWLKRLRLPVPGLTHQSGHLVADVIRHQPVLEEVHLGWEDIGDARFVDVEPPLLQCQYLEALNLESTGLTCCSMELLASVLAKLPSVKELNLQDDQINANGCCLVSK